MWITGSCKKEIGDFKSDLSKEFEMYDLTNISYFLDIEFYRNNRGLMLHQRRYASETIKRIEMEECNATLRQAETILQLAKDSDKYEVDPTQYMRLIRSLRYLCHIKSSLA